MEKRGGEHAIDLCLPVQTLHLFLRANWLELSFELDKHGQNIDSDNEEQAAKSETSIREQIQNRLAEWKLTPWKRMRFIEFDEIFPSM